MVFFSLVFFAIMRWLSAIDDVDVDFAYESSSQVLKTSVSNIVAVHSCAYMIFIRIKTKQKDLTNPNFDCIIMLLSTTLRVYYVMAQIEQLVDYVSDPYNGPEEGIDFWVDEHGFIQVQDPRTAALIMRKANFSQLFDDKLVKVGQRGDSIILGFDTLLSAEPVYTARIGYKGDTLVEVKQDQQGMFCLYVNKKRATRMFKKLTSTKTFIKRLDKELQDAPVEPETYDE